MDTKDLLRDFAAFCFKKYNLEIQPFILKDYIQTTLPIEPKRKTQSTSSNYHFKECSSNNISCSHVSFDSVKCNDCEYFYPPSPISGNYK